VSQLVALVGNPNTGKTTLFNALTGSSIRVGNYPGITVERTVGTLRGVPTVDVLDVPGAYSLTARSDEERIAVDALLGHDGQQRADLVVVVLDATQLERNLYLALQILELGQPTLLVLNQMDAAERAGTDIDLAALSDLLGAPVVGTVGTDPKRTAALVQTISGLLADPPPPAPWAWQPDPALQADIDALLPFFAHEPTTARPAMALWALMSVDPTDEAMPAPLRTAVASRWAMADGSGRDLDLCITTARYAWLDAHAADFVCRHETPRLADRVDRILLHPVAGFGVFIGLMIVVFQSLFAWADPFIGWIEAGMATLSNAVHTLMPAGILADFISEAVIGGVGNVLVFLPQIALLFLFIGLMEDTGYMARVAFLMDRIMRRVGLHGRAFVPMLSGFACAVPAIMATRALERRRDRLLTMMVLPLMTCSARLPVYTLIIGAVVPATVVLGIFNQQSLVLVAMYFFAVGIALVAAAVLGRTVLKGQEEPLLLELPDYRVPSSRTLSRLVWSRSAAFIKEAGTVILMFTVVLWVMVYFPRTTDGTEALEAQRPAIMALADASAVAALDQRIEQARREESYAGQLGRAFEPLTAPLGFDWRINVGLIGAFAAREVFVSTLGVIYGVGADVDEESASLRKRLSQARHADGELVYTPLVGLSLLIFFALACQCMSTLAVVKRETRSWRWPIFMFVYMTTLAWGASFVVYQGGRLMGFG
jgi:ferrous iron transport protein B